MPNREISIKLGELRSAANKGGLKFVAEAEFLVFSLLFRLLLGKRWRRFLIDARVSIDGLMAKHFLNKELGFFRPATRLESMAWTGNFDEFRECYEHLSFDDLKIIYKIWQQKYPVQKHYDEQFVLSCIKKATSDLSRNIRVVELGGYDGELAFEMLKEYPEMEWLNIEIIRHKIFNGLEECNYEEHVLARQVWEENLDLSQFDIFVSGDTFEHFTDVEVGKLIDFIAKNEINYLILKMPILYEGQTWNGAVASHLLNIGIGQVKKLLCVSYELILEKERDSWLSFWKLRNEDSPAIY